MSRRLCRKEFTWYMYYLYYFDLYASRFDLCYFWCIFMRRFKRANVEYKVGIDLSKQLTVNPVAMAPILHYSHMLKSSNIGKHVHPLPGQLQHSSVFKYLASDSIRCQSNAMSWCRWLRWRKKRSKLADYSLLSSMFVVANAPINTALSFFLNQKDITAMSLFKGWKGFSSQYWHPHRSSKDMQTATVDEKGTQFAYLDSGATDGNYTTLVIVHGHSYHAREWYSSSGI